MPGNEVAQLLSLTKGDVLKVIDLLEKQLNTLYQRAQALMSLAGVIFTITGFSGRAIAGASRSAQILVISGLAMVLASAVWIYFRVMYIKWITAELQPDPHDFLITTVRRRNQKTFAYALGGKMLLTGLSLYCIAFFIMLLHA